MGVGVMATPPRGMIVDPIPSSTVMNKNMSLP